MKTFVNSLTIFRIIASFALIPTLMSNWYLVSFILFTLAAASDFFDGYLAQKYNTTSKIGGVMDHMADKFLVVNMLILLSIMMPIWFIIVPSIIMICRELYISGLREFLGTEKIEMPVPKARFSMGKIKATLQMVAIGGFLLIFLIPGLINPMAVNQFLLFCVHYLPDLSIIVLWLALTASLWSATEYTIDFIKVYKKIKKIK